MQESIEEYVERIAGYSSEDLKSIALSIDQKKNAPRYAAVLAEIQKRKTDGTWISERVKGEQRYRTLLRRTAALLIDSLVIIAIALFIGFPFAQLAEDHGADPMKLLSLPIMVKASLIQLASLTYIILLHWRYGATLGKMAMGIRVVDYVSEGRITLLQSVLREVVPLGAFLITAWEILSYRNAQYVPADYSRLLDNLWSWAEIITALFSPKRRAIHDRIAKTICVRT
jgi:uncharacterized RDD family membrane protein YckC